VTLYVNQPLPIFANLNFRRLRVGNQVALPITSFDADSVLAYNLPPGLTFDTLTRVIGGIPAVLGDFAVSLIGSNRYGLGNASLPMRVTQIAGWGGIGEGETSIPAGLTNIVALAAGSINILALRDNDLVSQWATDGSGPSSVPEGVSNIVAISSGWGHNLALRRDGTTLAWGSNSHGQAS
jgi:hypothetical protein